MRLFLDTSVLLAASGSVKGASRFLILKAAGYQWELLSSDYCEEETSRNLQKLGRASEISWKDKIRPRVRFVASQVSLDKPLIFSKLKDRPIVITALGAQADWLLTLDERDFQKKLGEAVYGLQIATPGEFLLKMRERNLI